MSRRSSPPDPTSASSVSASTNDSASVTMCPDLTHFSVAREVWAVERAIQTLAASAGA